MLKRGDHSQKVYRMQRRLQSLDVIPESVIKTGRGIFGPSTQKAAVDYFRMLADQVEAGEIEIEHWRALFPFWKSLPLFNGDTDWVHAQEGHAGKAYWPKGQSGVTLDPGCDLGYIDPQLFKDAYEPILSPSEVQACLGVIAKKIRGEKAVDEINSNRILKNIRISRDQADDAFPVIASKYWLEISNRFPTLKTPDCPPSVQTALLSLAYNRGAHNKDLEQLRQYTRIGNWIGAAKAIGNMQQGHKLPGIRKRRRLESEMILKEIQK